MSDRAERLDRFMGRANAAYYASHDPFRDFATAPEISQMFGEVLALWVAAAWAAAGRPAPFLLAEAGPGRGTLMADVTRTLARIDPAAHAAARVQFIETSPSLRQAQASRVPDATWHDSLSDLPPGPMILLGNEFLDALPIRQFVRRGDGWTERHVAAGAWVEQPLPPAEAAALVPPRPGVQDGAVVEINEPARAFVAALGKRIAEGTAAALLIDYGPAESAAGDSLQAIRDQRMSDPLASPGDADLTAHVDFADLAAVARAAGAHVQGPVTQGRFLTDWGLFIRAQALAAARPDRAAGLRADARRLAAPDAMGTLFKVMALTPPAWPDLLRPR